MASNGTARMGRLAGIDAEGRLLVTCDGVVAPPLACAIGVADSEAALRRAVTERRPVLFVVPEPEGSPPVVIALVRAGIAADTPRVLEVRAGEQLVVRCGRASITLRKDGRVTVRGTRVVSASSGANKIKGATIALN
jgi:hypothetical protein